MAPAEESDAPRQDPQRQLAEMARAKSEAAKRNALAGQGDLFAAPAETPQSVEAPAAESLRAPLETADDSPLLATAATTPPPSGMIIFPVTSRR